MRERRLVPALGRCPGMARLRPYVFAREGAPAWRGLGVLVRPEWREAKA